MKMVVENCIVLTLIIARVVKSRFFCLQDSWELLETEKIRCNGSHIIQNFVSFPHSQKSKSDLLSICCSLAVDSPNAQR